MINTKQNCEDHTRGVNIMKGRQFLFTIMAQSDELWHKWKLYQAPLSYIFFDANDNIKKWSCQDFREKSFNKQFRNDSVKKNNNSCFCNDTLWQFRTVTSMRWSILLRLMSWGRKSIRRMERGWLMYGGENQQGDTAVVGTAALTHMLLIPRARSGGNGCKLNNKRSPSSVKSPKRHPLARWLLDINRTPRELLWCLPMVSPLSLPLRAT